MTKAKHKTQGMLDEAGTVLADMASHVAGYTDHNAFRRALIDALEAHPGFKREVRSFHGGSGKAPLPPKAGQTGRTVVPAGRVQAPRHDSPRGAAPRSKGR